MKSKQKKMRRSSAINFNINVCVARSLTVKIIWNCQILLARRSEMIVAEVVYDPNKYNNYWVASMAIPVGKWVGFVCFISIFFSVSVKVLPVTPLVSGVFVHRAFCAYFLRIERVVEMHRFLWWTQENH